MQRRLILPGACAALALAMTACTDAPVSPDADVSSPFFAILDGGHAIGDVKGNPDVFFLPPLTDFDATDPNFEPEQANPNLVPTARVCALNATEAVPDPTPLPLACIPEDPENPGNGFEQDDLAMAFSATGGFYQANLKDIDFTLHPDTMYRIEIFLGTLALGAFRDIDPDEGPNTASCTDEPFCQFNSGGSGGLPIKVIIEQNAACIALNPAFKPNDDVCATATLTEGGTLVLTGSDPLAAVTVNSDASVNIQSCPDLRGRGSSIDDHSTGRIDLQTWGPCLEIETFETAVVSGLAELCLASGVGGLSPNQIERLTIHRHSSVNELGEPDLFTFALGHGDATICDDPVPPPPAGGAYQFTNMQKVVRFARRTWRDLSEMVLPAPLVATFCNRGCASSGPFQSSYQVAGPAAWDFDASNPAGKLGTHDQGTIVTARANVFDSGEFEDPDGPDGPDPAPDPVPDAYEDLRVTVTLNGVRQPDSVLSDVNGLVEFSFPVVGGVNTVDFEAIGVGSSGVLAPAMSDPDDAEIELSIGKLTFTAIGLVPLKFEVQPDLVINIDESTGFATWELVQVCTVGEPPVEGIPVTIVAVTNNGSTVELTIAGSTESDPIEFPLFTDENGCVTFEVDLALQINKTGAIHLVVNPEFNSRGKVIGGDAVSIKSNVKPPSKKIAT